MSKMYYFVALILLVATSCVLYTGIMPSLLPRSNDVIPARANNRIVLGSSARSIDIRYNSVIEKVKPSVMASNQSILKPKLVTESGFGTTHPAIYITAVCSGRLGNQLLQYAALYALARRNKMWTPFLVKNNCGRLRATFPNISIPELSLNISGFKTHNVGRHADEELPKLRELSTENTTLHSNFVSHKYFDDFEDDIRQEFRFAPDVRQKVLKYLGHIEPQDWRKSEYIRVGIQVRRTDRIGKKWDRYGAVHYPLSYFYRAMEYFTNNHSKVQFIVASDDIKWCEKNLHWPHMAFSRNDYIMDLALLSMCDHVITTAWTYSWWAGWLCPGTTIYYGVMPDPNTPWGVVHQNKSWVPPPDSPNNKWRPII